MPSPPRGVLERLNYVADFLFDPCDAPFTLYVRTMLPALLEAAILWWAPVPDEIFTAWARPTRAMGRMRSRRKGTRGSKGGRRGPRSRLGRIINFDTNEFIGKRLPGAEKLGAATLNSFTFNLWRIFGFLQLLGLVWLVWEVISGFFVRWFSLLYETEYCKATTHAILDSYSTGYQISEIVENNAFLALIVRKQRGLVSVVPGGGSIGVHNGKVIASVTLEGSFPENAWLEIVFWPGSAGQGEPLSVQRAQVGGEGLRVITAAQDYPKAGAFGISLRTNVLLMTLTETSLYVQAGPSE